MASLNFISSNRTLLELKFANAYGLTVKDTFQSYLTGIEIHDGRGAYFRKEVPIVPYWN